MWASHDDTSSLCLHQKKQKHVPSLLEFNRTLDRISHDDPIGYLFIVGIKFYNKNPKTLLFNEIYPPILEKNKKNRTI